MSVFSFCVIQGRDPKEHFWRSKAALKPGVQPGFLDVGWQVKGKKTQEESGEKGLEMEKGIGWSLELVCLLFLDF